LEKKPSGKKEDEVAEIKEEKEEAKEE